MIIYQFSYKGLVNGDDNMLEYTVSQKDIITPKQYEVAILTEGYLNEAIKGKYKIAGNRVRFPGLGIFVIPSSQQIPDFLENESLIIDKIDAKPSKNQTKFGSNLISLLIAARIKDCSIELKGPFIVIIV
jgi:hypothetical protein